MALCCVRSLQGVSRGVNSTLPSAQDEPGAPGMQMYATQADDVERWVRNAGGRVVGGFPSPPEKGFEGAIFAVARQASAFASAEPDH